VAVDARVILESPDQLVRHHNARASVQPLRRFGETRNRSPSSVCRRRAPWGARSPHDFPASSARQALRGTPSCELKLTEIDGLKAYPSVTEVSEPLIGIIATPRPAVAGCWRVRGGASPTSISAHRVSLRPEALEGF
jgi:hypothetical protein